MADLPESDFPLRLIDIQATLSSKGGLCFHAEPKDWDFYTISHTWSRSMKLLSEDIGSQLGKSGVKQGTKESMREYNEAFQNADLRSNEGYLDLREFLKVLMEEEGVKASPRVWFDVLCINQQDSNEKDREIRRMAPYYKHSEGCYVLTHGVGQGYHLWPKVQAEGREDYDRMKIPRWFTRVWTLQEFVLPKKMMFLVGELSESTATWANRYMETFGPSLCDCWLSSSRNMADAAGILTWRELRYGELRASEMRNFLRGGAPMFDPLRRLPQAGPVNFLRGVGIGLVNATSNVSMNAIANIYNTRSGYQVDASYIQGFANRGGRGEDVRCECGGSSSGSEVRKVKRKAVNFVDSAAYFVLLVLESQEYVGRPITGGKENVLGNVKKMLGMRQMRRLEEGEGFADMLAALDERECTVEEDRVLGIMGLLGVQDGQDMKQLRTGKSLREQLVSVAGLMPHDKLIKLVAASADRPHFFDGMSWAPVLSRDPFAGTRQVYPVTRLEDHETFEIPQVQHSVHVVGVSHDGLLNLKAKLVRARLIPNRGTGHLGLVGAGITPRLPYCAGCGHVHVHPHALLHLRPPHACHSRVLPCPRCFEIASPHAPSLREFYHAVAEYELQLVPEGKLSTLPSPINQLSAHYFSNAFTLFMRARGTHEASSACYIQLPISPCRNFEQFLIKSSVAIPRKVNRRDGPFQYFVPIDVSLLLLGSSCDGERRVGLACIGERQRLHRIGLFHFPAEVGDAIFGDVPDTYCSLGSLDLNLFVENIFFISLSNTYRA